MKNMYDYVNYIEVDKSIDELEKDFIQDFVSFRKENNLTQELLAMYSKVNRVKISRIESLMHSPTIKNLLQILGPLGYTIKIEKIKRDKDKINIITDTLGFNDMQDWEKNAQTEYAKKMIKKCK